MGSPWKALSDDNRRQILLLLKNREMTPSEMAKHLQISMPAASTHLKVLREADLIVEQRHGKNKLYSINQEQALDMMIFFEDMWGYKLDSLKEFVENKQRRKRNDG